MRHGVREGGGWIINHVAPIQDRQPWPAAADVCFTTGQCYGIKCTLTSLSKHTVLMRRDYKYVFALASGAVVYIDGRCHGHGAPGCAIESESTGSGSGGRWWWCGWASHSVAKCSDSTDPSTACRFRAAPQPPVHQLSPGTCPLVTTTATPTVSRYVSCGHNHSYTNCLQVRVLW